MREILFRAKRVDNGEWAEGYYAKLKWCNNIIHVVIPDKAEIDSGNSLLETYEINPETLCQYTGLKDKNGKRIWENDIVKHEISGIIGTVKWYEEDYVGWCVDDVYVGKQQSTNEMWSECEVIGNVFDDKHLLAEMEQYYIKLYAEKGWALKNKTAGSQGVGKVKIADFKPAKGYMDGLKQGRKNMAKELSHIIDKHLTVQLREDKQSNKVSQRAFEKFKGLLEEGK